MVTADRATLNSKHIIGRHLMNKPASSHSMLHKAEAVLRSQQSRTTALCLALLMATLWLATRPYLGVIHDSRFYTIEALSELIPGRFADDLYFRYGSQGQFTLFTQIYKPFLAAFGVAYGNLILTIIAQGFWLTGLFYLTRKLFLDRTTVSIAMAAVIMLPGGPILQYGEQFLTPRLFAEALTFWALGSMLRDRQIRALLLLCVSITIHPLMTLPGLAVLFFHEAIRRPALWAAGAVTVIGSLGLAFSGVQPFARLLMSFDPAWFAVVRVRDFFSLLTLWNIFGWTTVCNMIALAALGLVMARPDERRFLVTVFAVGVGGLILSLIGGDYFRNVLIVDIQAWRATWLLQVVAHLFVAPVFFRIQKRGETPFAAILFALAIGLLALSQFFVFIAPGAAAMAAMMVIAAIVGSWEQLNNRAMPITARVLVVIFVGAALGLTAIALNLSYNDAIFGITTLVRYPVRGTALTLVALGAIVALLIDTTNSRKGEIRTVAILCLAIALVTVAGFVWDQRTPWTKFIDTSESPPDSLTSLLPGDSPIYWDDDVTVPWFLLKRPSYFSCAQGTGAFFYRGTAINYQHRYESFQSLRTLDFGWDLACPSAEGDTIAPLSRTELSSVCEKESGLAALVLTQAVIGAPERVWVSPVEFEDAKKVDGKWKVFMTDKFYVYSCADLR